MRGKLTVLKVDGSRVVTNYDSPVPLEHLQAAVGGDIEVVPRLTTFEGEACVAFCDEEGKLRQAGVNSQAQALWQEQCPLIVGLDVLVGDVAFVQGDDAFMGAL